MTTNITAPITIVQNNIDAPVTVSLRGEPGAPGLGIVADPISLLYEIIDGFKFNTTPTGTPNDEAGEVYWNNVAGTLNIVTGFGNIIQIGQEIFGLGVNKTGIDIAADEPRVVYLSGVNANKVEFGFSNSSDYEKTKMVGVTTAAAPKNEYGPVTIFGVVRDIDTTGAEAGEVWNDGDKLYIAPNDTGILTNVLPTNGYHTVWVATVMYAHGTQGYIFVNPIHDIRAEFDSYEPGWDYAGIYSRAESTIAFDDGTRTFSITPTGTSFDTYYGKGVYPNTGDSVVLPDLVGLHFIYLDAADHDLKASMVEWEISGLNVPVAMVYWDGTSGWLMEERHGIRNDAARELHEMLHQTVGARYAFGFSGTFGNTTFSIDAGEFYDDNLEHVITPKTNCRLLYRNASNQMQDTENVLTPYAVDTGNIQYDNAGVLTNVTNNYYVTNWIYITNDIDYPVYIVVGQNQSNKIEASRATEPTIPNITTREWKLLYAVTYKNAAGTPTFQESLDYRASSSLPGGSITALPASSIVFAPIAGLLGLNVQSVIEEISGYEIETITGTSTCVIDLQGRRLGQFKFTATENVTLSVINPPASGSWGLVLQLTNGGAYTVSYTSDWMEAGGTALTFTAAGTDRVLITGEGSTATTVVISVTQADVK